MPRFLTLVGIIAVFGPSLAVIIPPAASHDGDRAALLSFKSGVWGNLSDWGSPRVCDWTGVKCDPHSGRVTSLLLSYSNLTGVISPAIGNLSMLEMLELHFNHLSGRIPPELGTLSRLSELSLHNNLFNGTIPETLGLLKNMTYLLLDFNNLSGDIPEAIFCNCSSLTSISLSSNSLTGEIPFPARCRLPGLSHLSLYDNRLFGEVPASISNCTGMQSVLLSDNSLGGVLPSQMFNKMRHLKYLYLSHNNFSSDDGNTNLEPFLASLVNCTSLQELGIYSNGIGGEIPTIVGNLSMLEMLELHLNHLSGRIPPELGTLSRLSELSLHDNLFNGTIPETLGLLKNMTYLLLDFNNLSGDIPEAIFCNCSNLTFISLSSNSLTGEIPFPARCRLPGLSFLSLYENRLFGEIPASISNCTGMQSVLLSDNSLGGVLPSQMFNKMRHLKYLYLSHNNFSSDDGNTNLEPFLASLVNCTSLQELGIYSNGIGGEIPTIVGNLSTNLSLLFLNDNNITGVIPPAIGNLPNLTQLCLFNNMLEGPIPPEILRTHGLTLLDLSNNRITGEIPKSIGMSKHFVAIDISQNRLQGAIPETLSNLTNLDRLILHHNMLSGAIPRGLRCKLTMDLSYNKLTGQIPAEIASLGSFNIYLNLSNNLLEGPLPLQIGNMEMTRFLDLSANKLTGEIPMQIGGCIALEYVNLSRNALQGNLPTSIGSLPNLHVLDVSFNSLTGVLPQSLQASPALEFANFSYNKFSGELSSEGAFANLTDDSFLGNSDLCGSIPGMVQCNGRHVRLLCIVVVVVVAVVAGVLVMVCVTVKPLRFLSGPVSATGEKEREHPRISYRELVDATDGFSEVNLIGKGGYGHVYRGVAHDGMAIAVKVLHQDHYAGGEIVGSFERECRVLRSIRHRNLIRVITACSTPDFKALVLPFMPNGSLEGLIHPPHPPGTGKPVKHRMDLDLLLRIASNVADGMAYLHHHAPFKVVHCDLKPSNVLLDDDMTAIVSDFGISKLMKDSKDPEITDASTPCNSITRLLQGSVGYIAPEYGLGGQPSTQGDVYSFGVMLLELVSGKRPTDVISEEGHSLHEWIKNRYQHDVGTVIERSPLRDPPSMAPLSGGPPQCEGLEMEVIVELLELGTACSLLVPSMRPSMDDVAREIAYLKDGTWRKYRAEDLKADDQPCSKKC